MREKRPEPFCDSAESSSTASAGPRKRKITTAKSALFALVTLVFVLAGMEVALRVAGFQFVPPSDFAIFTHSNDVFGRCIVFDPETLYRLKPGAEIDYFGTKYQINSLGWRGPEFTPRKPPGTRRIVAVGDSNVFGYRLTPDQTFESVLGRLAGESVAAVSAGRGNVEPVRIEVLNCGVLGFSSFQTRQALKHYVFAYEPDILIVNVGSWNEGLWAVHPDNEQWAIIRRLSPRGLLYQSRLVQFVRKPIVSRFRQKHIEQLLNIVRESREGRIRPDWQRRVSYEDFARDVEWIYNECRNRGITVFFLSPILRPSMAAAREPVRRYREALFSLEPTPPNAIIDLAKLVEGIPEDEVFQDMDPVHWRAPIHELIAHRLMEHVAPLIEDWCRQDSGPGKH